MSDEPERIRCSNCGKSVSTSIPKGVIIVIRAWIQCAECIEEEEKERMKNND